MFDDEEGIFKDTVIEYHNKTLTFKITCLACPEQYDVFDEENNQVAYVRLRYGKLKAHAPDYGGLILYEHKFNDDLKGAFDSDEGRMIFLNKIAEKIVENIYEG